MSDNDKNEVHNQDSFRRPKELLEFAGLSKDETVLDVSTGFGDLAKHIIRVTPNNVDAQNGSEWRELFESFGIQKVIDDLETNFKIKHHWESFEEAGLNKKEYYDLVTFQNSLHDIYAMEDDNVVDRTKMFQSIWKAMKPNGRFLVVDHKAGEGRGKLDAKDLHRIDEELVRKELQENGFIVSKTSDMYSFAKDDSTASAWKEPSIETDRFVLLCHKKNAMEKGKAPEREATKDEPPTKKSKH